MPLYRPALLISTVLFLTACATPAPDLSNISTKQILVAAKNVVIGNYIPVKEYDPYSRVYASGFFPLPDDATTPSFKDLVFKGLSTHLHATGGENSDKLEIDVFDASLQMESNFSDSVVFVNIATAFSERKYMCKVDANFKYAGSSTRKTFEEFSVKSRSWGDLPTDERGALVKNCLDKIISDIGEYSVKLTRQ